MAGGKTFTPQRKQRQKRFLTSGKHTPPSTPKPMPPKPPTTGSDAISDNDLIARVIARGDQHAFSELVKRHQSPLRASLRKMTGGKIELSDDIAQETFILAWRNIDKFRFEAKFSTWLYRIAFNTWQSDVRKKSEVPLDEEGSVEAEPVESHAPQLDTRRDLERAMVDLSDAERAAIHQCYYNDLSHDEAAYVLQMPLGTLKTHVLRAKEKMRKHLDAYSDHVIRTGTAA
jgi:RNA polymerase sigma-70 factor, ECF subfamily